MATQYFTFKHSREKVSNFKVYTCGAHGAKGLAAILETPTTDYLCSIQLNSLAMLIILTLL